MRDDRDVSWPLRVVALAFLFGGAVVVYMDVQRHVDDPADSHEPMKAAVWWVFVWPVALYLLARTRQRSRAATRYRDRRGRR